jgi:cation diffusion facilitator family transporter
MLKWGVILTGLLVKLFIKDYQNVSDAKVRERYGTFASIVGILSNVLLFAVKIIVGTVFNSIAIVADAINNLADSGSSLVSLLGFKISGKPPDAEHPYGHARMEYIAGVIVSFIIMLIGFELIRTSVEKIINPQTVQFSLITIAALSASIIIKLWQFLFYRKIGRIIDSHTLSATSYDILSDTISTSAILLSLVITRISGVNLDGYMGVLVAVFIVFTGYQLIKATISPLLGMAPSQELVREIQEKILSYEGIIGMHDLMVHNYGAGKCYAYVDCEVDAEDDIMDSHDLIDKIERDFMDEMGIHLVIHLDPVLVNDEKTDRVREQVEEILLEISPQLNMHDFRVVWDASHTKLIFDVEVPFDFPLDHEDLKKEISVKIRSKNRQYHALITVDHHYLSNSLDQE